MSNNVLIVVEARGGNVKRPSLEALAAGIEMAGKTGGQSIALVAGDSLDAAVEAVKTTGVHKVVAVQGAALANFSSDGWATELVGHIQEMGASAILMTHSAMAKELMPRISAHLDTGLITDVTAVNCEGGQFSATKPVYAGKAYLKVNAKTSPFCATLRPNAFQAPAGGGNAEVENREPKTAADAFKAVVKEVVAGSTDRVPLQEAKVVVAGGRGLKEPEHFKLVEDLAAAFGSGVAAVGASRAVVDAGWRPHREQVGQTGKVVAPSLYIACGVSGAIQHLAGMRTSGTIVAINKDPEAPIFKVADYGIVGDVFEVLPALTEAVKSTVAG